MSELPLIMKTYIPILAAIACVFSMDCFAQHIGNGPANMDSDNSQLLSDSMKNGDLVVVSYHVEEKINMQFGSHTTTYEVSDIDLVGKTDLGPNNSRTITPKFGKAKPKALLEIVAVAKTAARANYELPKASLDVTIIQPIKTDAVVLEKKDGRAYINTVDTYERILDKGYRSEAMVRKVAEARFFESNYARSAQWYGVLFSMTTDLEDAHYFRYAKSLKEIGQVEKAKEMMAIFESKVAKSHQP